MAELLVPTNLSMAKGAKGGLPFAITPLVSPTWQTCSQSEPGHASCRRSASAATERLSFDWR